MNNYSKNKLTVALLTIEEGINRDKGGPTRVIYNLLRENKKRDGQLKIVCIFSKQIVGRYLERGEREVEKLTFIRKFLKKYVRKFSFTSSIIDINRFLLSCVRFVLTFRKYCRENKIDIVNAHDAFSGFFYLFFFKRKVKAPLILTIHSKGSWVKREFLAPSLIKKLFFFIEKFSLLNADIITFPSMGAVEYFIEDIPSTKKIAHKIKIIHNGIDVQEFHFGGEENIIDILEKVGTKKIILSVTALVIEKGVDILVRAFVGLKDEIKEKVYLVIVGTGPEYQNIKKILSNDSSGNFMIIDKLKHEQIISLMKASTIFVLPHRVSIFDYVLLEAMLCRLPVITTPVGGNLEIFTDKNSAVFVQKENIEELRKAIEYLLENEEARRKIADIAYNLVTKKFTIEKMFDAYQDLYKAVWNKVKANEKENDL